MSKKLDELAEELRKLSKEDREAVVNQATGRDHFGDRRWYVPGLESPRRSDTVQIRTGDQPEPIIYVKTYGVDPEHAARLICRCVNEARKREGVEE